MIVHLRIGDPPRRQNKRFRLGFVLFAVGSLLAVRIVSPAYHLSLIMRNPSFGLEPFVLATNSIPYWSTTNDSITNLGMKNNSNEDSVADVDIIVHQLQLHHQQQQHNSNKSNETNVKGIPLYPPIIPPTREQRFPSIEERVKIYMTDWYVPPCVNYTKGFVSYKTRYVTGKSDGDNNVMNETEIILENEWTTTTTASSGTSIQLGSTVLLERIFATYKEDVVACIEKRNYPQYCGDLYRSVFPAIHRLNHKNNTVNTTNHRHKNDDDDDSPNVGTVTKKGGWDDRTPIILQIGDRRRPMNLGTIHLNMPHIKKFRLAVPPDEVQRRTTGECYTTSRFLPHQENNGGTGGSGGTLELENIVWKLNINRHYGPLQSVNENDIPWKDKISKAVFRGKLTGPVVGSYDSDLDLCQQMPRCSLVMAMNESQIVDAKLTDLVPSEYIGGIKVLDSLMSMPDQLRYKALIILEGNDVATGLKWALLSNSVVLMPRPTKMTYAMEDQLIPYVHYVPINDDLSNVEEQMQWILDHDEYAEQIAIRSTLWIKDLVEHPDALSDHNEIEERILDRYQQHFLWKEEMEFLTHI
jgi:extradiol dioxygenase family protein